MRVLVLALVCLAALMSACAGGYQPGESAVSVHIEQEYDQSHGLYAEGSYSYVRVERLDGDELLVVRLEDEKSGFRLDPGTYRFLIYQRSCEATCESLDPPSDECQPLIRVERELEVRILAVAGLPCRLGA